MTELEQLFAQAGCRGWLCVAELDGDARISLNGDELVSAASVLKVAVALAAARQLAAGELAGDEQVLLTAAGRTAGPTGYSTFADDVRTSVRDLVRMMLTVSDNAATDVLLDRIGLATLHRTLRELGLTQTAFPYRLSAMLDSIGADAGFADWHSLTVATVSDEAALERRIVGCRALDPTQGLRTTPAEMVTLLRRIWLDQAGPPTACGMVRTMMAAQVSRQRLATGFGPGVTVAAKSGSLLGIVRNEIGVVGFPDGRRYAVAVFTRTDRQGAREHDINLAIGRAAALAIDALRG